METYLSDRASQPQPDDRTQAAHPGRVHESWFARRDSWMRFGLAARLANDKSGVAAIEYGLLCGLIALAVVTGITKVGGDVNKGFAEIEEAVAKATGNKGGNGKGKGKGKGSDK